MTISAHPPQSTVDVDVAVFANVVEVGSGQRHSAVTLATFMLVMPSAFGQDWAELFLPEGGES